MKRQEIIDKAREYVGTPFVFQGQLPGIGMDCRGFVHEIANSFNIPIVSPSGYKIIPKKGQVKHYMDLNFIPIKERRPGCVLMTWFSKMFHASHLAIFTGKTLVHVLAHTGSVVEHLIDEDWEGKIMGSYDFPGVDD